MVVPLEPQPIWNALSRKIPPSIRPSIDRRVRDPPPARTPRSVMPSMGNPMAYSSNLGGDSCVVVITRWTVLMMTSVLTFPFRFWKLGVVSVQVAAVGSPELHDTVMVPVKMPVGARVAVYCAGTPAGTVAAAGATIRLKSFTVTVALAPCVNVEPATVTVPLFDKETALVSGGVLAVGVRITVTVAVPAASPVPPAFNAPMLHRTVPSLGWPQALLEVEVVAETKPALVGSVSVKVMPLVKSPAFWMV